MAQTVFNWASVAKGKPQLTVDVEADKKEKQRIAKAAKAERERLAWKRMRLCERVKMPRCMR